MSEISSEIYSRALMPRDLLNQASSLHLAMHIAADSVEASLADAASTEILWSGIFETGQSGDPMQKAVDFILSCNWSERVFRKTTLSFDSNAFTLVPGAFFDVEKMAEVLAFNTGKSPEKPGHILLNEAGAQIIFDTPEVMSQLEQKFPNLRIFPGAWVFGKYAAQQSEKNNNFIHLYVNGSYLLVAVFKSQKLMMLNKYEIGSAEDLLYYTANAAIRLEIDLENCEVKLFDHLSGAEHAALLKNYCRNVELRNTVKSGHQVVHSSTITQIHLVCA